MDGICFGLWMMWGDTISGWVVLLSSFIPSASYLKCNLCKHLERLRYLLFTSLTGELGRCWRVASSHHHGLSHPVSHSWLFCVFIYFSPILQSCVQLTSLQTKAVQGERRKKNWLHKWTAIFRYKRKQKGGGNMRRGEEDGGGVHTVGVGGGEMWGGGRREEKKDQKRRGEGHNLHLSYKS